MVPTGVSRKRKRTRAAPSDRSPSRWQRARSPLSTGCPGPFHAQPPVQPDLRRRPLSPSPMPHRPRERLDADASRRSEPDEPVGPASEPGAGLSSNIPRIAAMSTTNLGLRATRGESSTTLSRNWGKCSLPAGPGARARPAFSAHLPPSVAFVRPGPPIFIGSLRKFGPWPTCTPWFRGMDHPTWRHEILSAPASAADAVLPSGGDANG